MSACLLSEHRIVEAREPADIEAAQRLFRAYAAWLGADLGLQGFECELAGLPGAYAPPTGRLLLARVGGDAAGCVGLRPLGPAVAEMKRLWVEPGFGGRGIGRRLAEAIIEAAGAIGYASIRLDSIPAQMPAAAQLYRSLGFREIAPYYDSPLAGTVMFELVLAEQRAPHQSTGQGTAPFS